MEKSNSREYPFIPDAVNTSVDKGFTQIPNKLLRNPEITAKAKAVLCLLLSNKDGWKSHVKMMTAMMKENEFAIQSALKELESFGYLIRIKYKDKLTKLFVGAFWGYTDEPNKFNLKKQIILLEKNNMELCLPDDFKVNEPELGNPVLDNPELDNPVHKNTNISRSIYNIYTTPSGENTNDKKSVLRTPLSPEKQIRNTIPPTLEMVKDYCQKTKSRVNPVHWFDFYEAKGWMIGKNKMKDWQAAVRTWERNEKGSSTKSPEKKFIIEGGIKYYLDEETGNYYAKDGSWYR